MITYSVTISIQAGIESEWMNWMRKVHVPDVLRTGCFSKCWIYRVLEFENAEPTYVLQYSCQSVDDYHHYRDHLAAALQKEHTNRFTGRFRGSRQIFEEVAQIRPVGS